MIVLENVVLLAKRSLDQEHDERATAVGGNRFAGVPRALGVLVRKIDL